jgi:hypothetical protein
MPSALVEIYMTLSRIFTVTFAFSIFAGVAACATPGPQRMLAPKLFGLSKIADGVYTDDPSKAGLEMLMVSRANAKVVKFFGTLEAHPRYILCTTMMCEKAFGKHNSTAAAFGWFAIHIPPRGVNDPHLGEILLSHERTHTELLKRWGATALWDKKIPNWFNEGLATYVSGDDRIRLDHPKADLKWISQSKTFYDWGDFIKERGWRDAYGSAASYVALIHDKAGDAGLHSLIARTLDGEDFDAVLAEITR